MNDNDARGQNKNQSQKQKFTHPLKPPYCVIADIINFFQVGNLHTLFQFLADARNDLFFFSPSSSLNMNLNIIRAETETCPYLFKRL